MGRKCAKSVELNRDKFRLDRDYLSRAKIASISTNLIDKIEHYQKKTDHFLVCSGYLNRMFWKPLSESSVVCNYIESSFGLSYLSSKVIRAQLLVVFTRILYDSYIIHFIYICHVIIIIIIRLRTQFTTKKTNKTLLIVDFLIDFLLITSPPYQKMVYFNEEKIV